jgi:hypothetical protein
VTDSAEPTQAAASASVEALPGALESTAEAGPSKPAAPTKRRYEVDHADLEFCKRVSLPYFARAILTSSYEQKRSN